jgi:integrase
MVIEQNAKRPSRLRTIPLPSFAISTLKKHIARQAEERRVAGDAWRDRGQVFTSSIGTPIEPSYLIKHLHSVLKLLKIDRKRFHDLRHTAASLLLAQGATLHEVKEILGHSQIALTANLYGHAYTSVLAIQD